MGKVQKQQRPRATGQQDGLRPSESAWTLVGALLPAPLASNHWLPLFLDKDRTT